MVSPDFSEFQFAYGLTRELEESLGSNVVTPPVFPTQNQEEELGSDVIMGIKRGDYLLTPLFIQYKRSNRMIRSNANEWSDFNQEYFRFDIHNANQHNTLVDMVEKVARLVISLPDSIRGNSMYGIIGIKILLLTPSVLMLRGFIK